MINATCHDSETGDWDLWLNLQQEQQQGRVALEHETICLDTSEESGDEATQMPADINSNGKEKADSPPKVRFYCELEWHAKD